MENVVPQAVPAAPQGTGQFVGKAPTPGAQPIPAQLQGALEVAKAAFQKSQSMLSTVAPYVKSLELLDKQIERTHAMVVEKMQANEEYGNDQDELEILRDMFRNAHDEYAAKIREEELKAKQA